MSSKSASSERVKPETSTNSGGNSDLLSKLKLVLSYWLREISKSSTSQHHFFIPIVLVNIIHNYIKQTIKFNIVGV